MTRVDKDYHKRIILKPRNEKILKINQFIGHYFLTFINFAIQNIFLQNIVLVPMDYLQVLCGHTKRNSNTIIQ